MTPIPPGKRPAQAEPAAAPAPRTAHGIPQVIRECPATLGLMVVWVVVFVATVLARDPLLPRPLPSWKALAWGQAVNRPVLERYGSLTPANLVDGQWWRTVTATCLHMNVLHLGLNLLGLFCLGRLIEEWYGWSPAVLIFVLLGGLGNALAALARWEFQLNPGPSIGGSTIVFGLIGLCAVAGQREKTRFGQYLYRQMVGLLVLNGAIGLLLPSVDNAAHIGGALVGAAIGWFDPWLYERAHRSISPIPGLIGILMLVGCLFGQQAAHQIEVNRRAVTAAWVQEQAVRILMDELNVLRLDYHTLARPDPALKAATESQLYYWKRARGMTARVPLPTPIHRDELRGRLLALLPELRNCRESLRNPAAARALELLVAKALWNRPDPDSLRAFDLYWRDLVLEIMRRSVEVREVIDRAVQRDELLPIQLPSPSS